MNSNTVVLRSKLSISTSISKASKDFLNLDFIGINKIGALKDLTLFFKVKVNKPKAK